MVHEASHWTQPPSIVFKQSSYNVFCTSHSLLIHSHNGIPACTDHQSLLPRQRLTRRANAVCDILKDYPHTLVPSYRHQHPITLPFTLPVFVTVRTHILNRPHSTLHPGTCVCRPTSRPPVDL